MILFFDFFDFFLENLGGVKKRAIFNEFLVNFDKHFEQNNIHISNALFLKHMKVKYQGLQIINEIFYCNESLRLKVSEADRSWHLLILFFTITVIIFCSSCGHHLTRHRLSWIFTTFHWTSFLSEKKCDIYFFFEDTIQRSYSW